MSEYPIPVHCELKGTRGKIRPAQKVQKERIERSGGVYLLIDHPANFHQFFLDHGLDKIIDQPIKDQFNNKSIFTEKEINSFVRSYLKWAESIYGIYWERNHQSLGNTRGRPDYYFEIPNLKTIYPGEAKRSPMGA